MGQAQRPLTAAPQSICVAVWCSWVVVIGSGGRGGSGGSGGGGDSVSNVVSGYAEIECGHLLIVSTLSRRTVGAHRRRARNSGGTSGVVVAVAW